MAACIPHLRVQKKRLDKAVALAVVNELVDQVGAPAFTAPTNVLAIPADGARLNIDKLTSLGQLRFWLGRLVDKPTLKAVAKVLGWEARGAPYHRETLTNLVEVFSVGASTPRGSVVAGPYPPPTRPPPPPFSGAGPQARRCAREPRRSGAPRRRSRPGRGRDSSHGEGRTQSE
jgi:hypothetical protein